MRKSILTIIPLMFLQIITSCKNSCRNSMNDNSIFVSVSQSIEALDPRYTSSATSGRVSKLIYAPLFTIDEEGLPIPFLAKDITVIDDTHFRIILRENLFFHNGEKLTAEDVEYTYKNLSQSDVLSPHMDKFYYLNEITIESEHSLLFTLKEPIATFMLDLCLLGIVSKKSCHNRSNLCKNEFNGSGPFMLKKWNTAKETLYLTPFVQWFEGAPKNDVTIRTIRDENSRLLELLSQKTDIVDGDISPYNISELANKDFLEIKIMPSFGFSYLAFNLRANNHFSDKEKELTQKALSNQLVRKAIALSLNIDQIIEKIFLNHAQRVSGLIPNISWAKDHSLKNIDYDPQKANALLDKAGFKKRADNTRFNVTITTSQDRTTQGLALLYADFMKKIGINAKVKVKDWSAMYEDMKKGNFEMFSAVWTPVTDPDLYFWVHHSSNIPSKKKAGGNRHAFINKEIDKLIELGRKTIDKEKRKIIYHEIERVMLKELPYIPLWNAHKIAIINKRVKNYKPSTTGNLINLRNAYL